MSQEIQQYIATHPVQLVEVVVDTLNAAVHSRDSGEHVLELKADVQGIALSELEGDCILGVTVHARLEGQDSPAMEVSLRLRGHCRRNTGGNKEQFEQFLKIQGFPLLLPYARELVTSTTTRMGFPPVVLPLIDVFETYRRMMDSLPSAGSHARSGGDLND